MHLTVLDTRERYIQFRSVAQDTAQFQPPVSSSSQMVEEDKKKTYNQTI